MRELVLRPYEGATHSPAEAQALAVMRALRPPTVYVSVGRHLGRVRDVAFRIVWEREGPAAARDVRTVAPTCAATRGAAHGSSTVSTGLVGGDMVVHGRWLSPFVGVALVLSRRITPTERRLLVSTLHVGGLGHAAPPLIVDCVDPEHDPTGS